MHIHLRVDENENAFSRAVDRGFNLLAGVPPRASVRR